MFSFMLLWSALMMPQTAANTQSPLKNCPKQIGQLRWQRVQLNFIGPGGSFEIEGDLWDRDHNGKPSAKDLLRIEEVRHQQSAMGLGPTWVVLDGALAKKMLQDFQAKPPSAASCESAVQVQQIAAFSTPADLGAHLRRLAGHRAASYDEIAHEDLVEWTEQLCKGTQTPIKQAQLRQQISARLKSAHPHAKGRALQGLVRELTAAHGPACANPRPPLKKLSFD